MQLKFGDTIYLNTLKDLTLAADGIFSADCSVQRLNQTFGTDEHLFKVVPRQYYDAAEELKKSSSANRIDEQQEKLLVESYNNEIKINQLRLEKKMHAQTSVVYGDTVMLQHVKSGRWLTVVTTKFAKVQNHHRCDCVGPFSSGGPEMFGTAGVVQVRVHWVHWGTFDTVY